MKVHYFMHPRQIRGTKYEKKFKTMESRLKRRYSETAID